MNDGQGIQATLISGRGAPAWTISFPKLQWKTVRKEGIFDCLTLEAMPVIDFNSLEQYLREQHIFDQFGLSRIGVFGSFVRGESFRDIDLLIDELIPYQQLIELRHKLQSDLHYPVDVMLREHAEPIILNRALTDVRYATRA